MHTEIKKTTKIVDEFTSMLIKKGSKEVDVKIKREDDLCTVSFIDYNTNISAEIADDMREFLNIQRQSEIEEYYWELMGESSDDDELFLVGSMVDKADVKIEDGNLYVKLYRKIK